jgi:hypothetical protein
MYIGEKAKIKYKYSIARLIVFFEAPKSVSTFVLNGERIPIKIKLVINVKVTPVPIAFVADSVSFFP